MTRASRTDEVVLRCAFDYVDPGSYVVRHIVEGWNEAADIPIETRWCPLELRTPLAPRLDPLEPTWSEMTRRVREHAGSEGVVLAAVDHVPWTRKAHELAAHARNKGCFAEVHRALFEAHFSEGRDIGRVDVLVGIGAEHGLEPSETRTVLGVDRYRDHVERERAEVLSAGVRGVPTLWAGEHRLEGFSDGPSLRTLLDRLRDARRADTASGS